MLLFSVAANTDDFFIDAGNIMWPTLSTIYLFLTGIPLIISNDRTSLLPPEASSENFKSTETNSLGVFEVLTKTSANVNISGPKSDENCAKSVGKCALSVASSTSANSTLPSTAASEDAGKLFCVSIFSLH